MSADFHVDLNHEAVRQMLGGCSNGTGGPGTGVGGQENGLCSPAEKKPGDCYLSLELDHWLCFPKQVCCRSDKGDFLPTPLHLTRGITLMCFSNALHAGHLLCDQPSHGHSDGGKSGKGADGKYCLWGRTLYQEYRLQQGKKVIFFIVSVILADGFSRVFTLLDLFLSLTKKH